MASLLKIEGGNMAVVERWNRGEEQVRLLRSFGENPDFPVGHYVLQMPGQDTVSSADVAEVRQAAAIHGFSRRVGNPRIVAGLLAHNGVEVLWWRHNLAHGQSFIREFNLGSPRREPLEESDLVVLSSSGRSCSSEHGSWVNYSDASRVQLDRAHSRCKMCLGTGVSGSYHFGHMTDTVCSCVYGRSYYGLDSSRTFREVKLDRWHVVVVGTSAYSKGELVLELLEKCVSPEAAEVVAEKWRKHYSAGSNYGYGRTSTGVKVREEPFPSWA